jgi:hypothetical protein
VTNRFVGFGFHGFPLKSSPTSSVFEPETKDGKEFHQGPLIALIGAMYKPQDPNPNSDLQP